MLHMITSFRIWALTEANHIFRWLAAVLGVATSCRYAIITNR